MPYLTTATSLRSSLPSLTQLPPDPDTGLSEEEKVRIVCVENDVHDDSVSVPIHPCRANKISGDGFPTIDLNQLRLERAERISRSD